MAPLNAADTDCCSSPSLRWYGVRYVICSQAVSERGDAPAGCTGYEERITIWQAGSFDDAIELAEVDARRYADHVGGEYAGLAQAYELLDSPRHGAEVFSLIRTSPLPRDAYLDRFFDTGSEHQQPIG